MDYTIYSSPQFMRGLKDSSIPTKILRNTLYFAFLNPKKSPKYSFKNRKSHFTVASFVVYSINVPKTIVSCRMIHLLK